MPNVNVLAGKYSPLGYEQVTSLSSAAGLTVPEGARMCIIQAEDQNVRWRDDGTNPTTTVGIVLAPEVNFTYSGNLGTIKFIEETATAKLNVAYYA
jgi:hypothetical protein